MDEAINTYLKNIGRRGGLKSRRKLSTDDAKNMVRVREARRAFKKYHTECFWSYSPDYKITANDVDWVAEKLMENGNSKLWHIGVKLCR